MKLPLRWTEAEASTEFNIDPKTLSKRFVQAEIQPGTDKKYSTPQICSAVFGDIDSERLRLTKEQADKLAIENAVSRGELVSGIEMQRTIERGLAAMVAAVNAASNLENEDKAKIINHLRAVGESVVGGASGGEAASELHGKPVV